LNAHHRLERADRWFAGPAARRKFRRPGGRHPSPCAGPGRACRCGPVGPSGLSDRSPPAALGLRRRRRRTLPRTMSAQAGRLTPPPFGAMWGGGPGRVPWGSSLVGTRPVGMIPPSPRRRQFPAQFPVQISPPRRKTRAAAFPRTNRTDAASARIRHRVMMAAKVAATGTNQQPCVPTRVRNPTVRSLHSMAQGNDPMVKPERLATSLPSLPEGPATLLSAGRVVAAPVVTPVAATVVGNPPIFGGGRS